MGSLVRSVVRALLYVRVSTEEQGKGYSLRQQIQALQDYCKDNGIEVIGVYKDKASGAYIDRPGLDALRDVVSAGGVNLVLTQDRDRFSREPAYRFILEKEFEEYGTKIRSLNDKGDDSPGGELTDGIFDQFAKYERAMTTERTRRGKIREAQEGKVVGTGKPPYGFTYADDYYHIDPERMPYVHMIFEWVGTGYTMHSIAQHLNKIGATTPGNGMWHGTTIRKIILNDVYAGTLWWGKERVTSTMGSKIENGERVYKKKVLREPRPPSEWIAIPVPDSGIPPESVRRAREAIEGNIKAVSKNADRTWELSGGVGICSECGKRMVAHTTLNAEKKRYHYYICSHRQRKTDNCSNRKHYRAGDLEMQVNDALVEAFQPEAWSAFVDDLCDRKISNLRKLHHSPHTSKERLAKRKADLEARVSRAQDLYIVGDLTRAEYEEKKASIQEETEALDKEFARVDDLGAEIRRVEDLRITLKGIENPLSGHYALTEFPESYDLVDIDKMHSISYGSKETAARRRQDFYRQVGMKVKVGDELEISLGIGEPIVSENGTPSG